MLGCSDQIAVQNPKIKIGLGKNKFEHKKILTPLFKEKF